MAIAIDQKYIDDIPVLIVHEQTQQVAPLPVIVYFHGFTSAKEQNLPLAYLLAESGYRVVLPEAMHHGERRRNISDQEVQFAFWEVVKQNLTDLAKIETWLTNQGLLEAGRFAVAGTSMGGITTAAALTQYESIRAAGIMMGTANMQEMADYLLKGIEAQGIELPFTEEELQEQLDQLKTIDLSQQIEALNDRPLFIWHGEEDPVVPYNQAVEFYRQLQEAGAKHVEFVSEPGRDHKVSRDAMLGLRDWLMSHL
ncbi:alpha/beta fold hydrolase [Alkalibacillus sp. S2W]|uniref:alpha/beta fold hydrolase n=1 Tax=Alkalibacillus sp. S2W TaxID=3386553 RepID=UPI00398D1C9D